ncbi:MAG: hypothetical protein H0T46_21540 [Deltaproteobacteria bacterium]|nr:hypothetical protein [Deltaproteobacteria bacterium]
MTYRDDHAAALARAEALEIEVKRERARANELRRQRDELAAKLARREPARPTAPQRRVLILQPTPSKSAGHEMIFLIAAMVGLFALAMIIAMFR